eukprot:TRINITY_DN1604_c0_g1_i1.p1 TRINITY_DN1604_c0_g1~~TRINITY_DN1604_c0_g1_i1.p1  ORF type:complete len:363 (+),score=118.95 TRINITY_DN1604_c0_g1_i1:36-1091(+)
MSLKLSVVTFVDADKVQAAVNEVLHSSNNGGYVLVRYSSPTNITFQSSSKEPAESLLPLLQDNEIQYALVRLRPDEEGVKKDVLITWVGPKVGKIERGKKSEHLADVQSVLGPTHVQLTALTKQGFHENKLRELAHPASGTHVLKPADEETDRATFQATIEADEKSRKEKEERIKRENEEKAKAHQQQSSQPKSPVAGPAVKLSAISCVELEHVQSVVAQLLHKSTLSGFVVLRYVNKDTVTLQASQLTGGVAELLPLLEDNQVQYVLLRLKPNPHQATEVSKDVFINWMGPKVSKIEQGKKTEHLGDAKEILKPHHAQVTCLTKNGFTDDKIRALADPTAGSHVLKADDQ